MIGYIHSIETFGTVDGPGVRFVVFLKGCPMRCIYCHNPDTWSMDNATIMTSEEILTKYAKNASFYKNGGITVTGGEPLLQLDFVIDLFKKAKENNIHTCLDTSGILFNENELSKYEELVKVTDLVMLDIKHIDNIKHKEITGQENKNILNFARFLDQHNIQMYIRHVVVDTYTTNENDLFELGRFIGSLKNVKALDVLPFHNLGKVKYEKLGLPYKLKDMEDLPKEKAQIAKNHILNGIYSYRQNNN
jgi:pyruvate formate lyase activating enzyme